MTDDEDIYKSALEEEGYDEAAAKHNAAALSSLTAEEIDEILELTYEDPVEFCKFFLHHKFPKEMPWVHRGILAIFTRKTDFLLRYGDLEKIVSHFVWKDENEEEHPIFHLREDGEGNVVAIDLDYTKYSMLMMPRGFSKTTLVGQAVILYFILFMVKKFIVYLSETAGHSEMQLNNVKAELEGNELIRAVFGNLVPDRTDPRKWTSTMFETLSDVVVACRGRGGQVRGLNHKGNRPDIILFDDVEDKESVKTSDQRLKTRDWFYSDVMPALPEMDPEATIAGLGTLLHQEALLMVLMKDPEWTSMVFSAIDRDGHALWPDNMSLAKLETKKKSYALAGRLASFYMEYMSQIRNDETAKFKESYFIIDPFVRQELITTAMVIDPAISDEEDADLCSIACAGMSEKGLIGVVDTWAKKGAEPREQVDRYFEYSLKNKVNHHGVEGIAYQRALIHLIREEMFRRGHYFEIEDIRHGRVAKDERILGVLQPRYASNYVVHVRRFPELETQLLDYPNGKKDLPDAVAMAITLLDPYAAQAADPEKDLGEDEYESLSELFGGDWRGH